MPLHERVYSIFYFMKLIPLTGKYAIGENAFAKVDDEDYERLMKWKWYVSKGRTTYYAHRGFYDKRINNMGKVCMHRAVMRVVDGKVSIDHKDHDGLNNQKSNLRLCDNFQNAKNKSSKLGASSKYIGVHFSTTENKWVAQISVGSINNRKIKSKRFIKEIDAAKFYDEHAIKIHGEFANLNFK